MDISGYKVTGICNDGQGRAMAHDEFVAKTCKALARAMKKRDREVAKRLEGNLARQFKLSRARVTQLLDLHKLHPRILDFVRRLSGRADLRLG